MNPFFLIRSPRVVNPGIVVPEINHPTLVIGTGSVLYTPQETFVTAGVGRLYANMLLHFNGQTVFPLQSRIDQLPYGQIRMLKFDNQKGFDVPINVGDVLVAPDTHNAPVVETFLHSSVEKMYFMCEDVHNAPLDRYRDDNADYSFFTKLADVATTFAYPNLIKDAEGNGFIWGRATTNWDNYIVKSTDGAESFGSQIQVSVSPTGTTQRHYGSVPMGYRVADGFIHVWAANRKDDGAIGNWYKYHKLKTPASGVNRGVVWYNELETYSHNLADSTLTQTEYDTHFKFHETADDDTQGHQPEMGVSSTGRTYVICGNGDGTFSFMYWAGGSVVKKVITIPDMYEVDPTGQRGPFDHVMPFADNDIRVVVQIDDGVDVRPHLFQTTDQGDTWTDLLDLCGDVPGTWEIRFPDNMMQLNHNENFAYMLYRQHSTDTWSMELRGKVAAWGAIQAIPGESVTAAGSMNYNSTGLFHYRATDADLTKTGNNVTAFVDLFGIRNGTASNNPQWNGSDSVAFVLASSQRISVGTPASIVNKTAFTYIIVGKWTTPNPFTCLSMSLNSATDRYVECRLNASCVPLFRVINESGATVLVNGQDNVAGGAKHCVAFVADGRASYKIYVDGKLQWMDRVINAGGTELTKWQTIGKGPATVGANVVNISMLDLSSGDSYTSGSVCEMVMYDGVMPDVELKSRIKKLCDDHGITYVTQYKQPT